MFSKSAQSLQRLVKSHLSYNNKYKINRKIKNIIEVLQLKIIDLI